MCVILRNSLTLKIRNLKTKRALKSIQCDFHPFNPVNGVVSLIVCQPKLSLQIIVGSYLICFCTGCIIYKVTVFFIFGKYFNLQQRFIYLTAVLAQIGSPVKSLSEPVAGKASESH